MTYHRKMELKLHSPAGADPVLYTWPLTSGRGNVSYLYLALHVLLVSQFANIMLLNIIIYLDILCSYQFDSSFNYIHVFI